MTVEVKAVTKAGDLRRFIYLPERLYEKGYPQWVHPIYASERDFFNPRKNPSWGYCEGRLYLARVDRRVVGRIMGIVNHRYNNEKGVRQARFGFFDCTRHQAVACALLETCEEWAKARGCSAIVGPMGFIDLDSEGMLVEGFEHRATITTWWHPSWTHKLVEEAGYSKELDWVTYLVDFTKPLPEVYTRIAQRIIGRNGFKLVEFKRRREFAPYVKPIFDLINDSYSGLDGVSYLDDDQITRIAADYIPLLDPRFVKVITFGDRLAGFALGIPDMTEGIRAARGRLFPFGIFKIMNAGRKTDQLDMLLGAISDEFRGMGLDVLMANALYESALKAGITMVDSHHELETNTRVRAEMERVGGRIYKRHRLFRKSLD
ncbi:hypothetical protein GF359_00705 [candidate division WOR-3 bacterium]|uniref:N-acetyltransferase domain-containing protein n=1 Tax=candidate division WOR-3 bacterium TaxID=2052148 RepID=A0A9D5K7H8_UNCW3|nr:hypothetical protein [candidate division WOR-3 bacterium]MBD3363713.1 hypothetical protein [candidate division WOR-3 bacterium]